MKHVSLIGGVDSWVALERRGWFYHDDHQAWLFSRFFIYLWRNLVLLISDFVCDCGLVKWVFATYKGYINFNSNPLSLIILSRVLILSWSVVYPLFLLEGLVNLYGECKSLITKLGYLFCRFIKHLVLLQVLVSLIILNMFFIFHYVSIICGVLPLIGKNKGNIQ